MTLADLLTTLESRGALKASRVKDCGTSLRYLAAALGQTTPDQYPVDAACREEATWAAALEDHFQALETQGRRISAITRRNTRNNLRVLLRAAEGHRLLEQPLPPRLLAPTKQRETFRLEQQKASPYLKSYRGAGSPQRYALLQAEWPPEIQATWRDYRAKYGLRLRESTLQNYVQCFAAYFGYLTHICSRTPTWDDLFEMAGLTEFVRWHAARHQLPITTLGRQVVKMVAAMANVLKHPHARELAAWLKALPTPDPMHTKRAHWVSLSQLEAVAETCLAEGRAPLVQAGSRDEHPGGRRASQFQRGVILKLLVRVPLRQRNVRELRLEKNLYQDRHGDWQLSLSGSELKVGTRGGRLNTYAVNLSQDTEGFIPVLEEFLRDYRPRLPGAQASASCFLTRFGRPFTQHTLWQELSEIVALHTGQRFYPHLIRTIWATEYLTATGDFTTAATMLGDNVQTVMKTYYDVVHKDQHAKAKAFLATALHAG
jgi:hypothetical protein